MSIQTTECCICYETIGEKNNCVTPCGHKFCFVCLTKALTNNNTCPCCREVLVEVEQDDDDSEYETESEDSDEDSDDENVFLPEDYVCINDVPFEDITDNAEIMYEKLIKSGVTKTEIVQVLTTHYFGHCRDDEELQQLDDKIKNIFGSAFADTIRENRIKKEQMMFLSEDKPSNVNALDMIALNYE